MKRWGLICTRNTQGAEGKNRGRQEEKYDEENGEDMQEKVKEENNMDEKDKDKEWTRNQELLRSNNQSCFAFALF